MASSKNHNADRLAECGLKRTKQRLAILDIFSNSEQPLPAEEVFLKMKENRIAVNLSTVYRTLETMVEKGLLSKIDLSGDNRMLYEYNRMVHRHYLVCVSCKKIIAVHHCPLDGYEKSLARETDYTITGHRLDIYGYCPQCRAHGLGAQQGMDSHI